VFRDARAYTVRIRTQITTPFMEDERGAFSGAGFLVDANRRWVLTNAHVVGRSPSDVQAAFDDGTFHAAKKIYVDEFTDMAVIEVTIEGKQRPVAPISCEATLQVGQGVGAFGHPLGMPFTGTRGIVSGLTDQFLADLIQIDATVDHGNSGGPVISLQSGEIVGIATAIAGGSKAERVNFATPMKDVCRILELLRKGIAPDPPQMEFALLVDEDERHTLQIGHTFNASRWPFEPGDRIMAVGSENVEVKTVSNLVTAFRGRRGIVPVRVKRGERDTVVSVRPEWRLPVLKRRGVILDGALIAPMVFEDGALEVEPARLVVQSVEPGSAAAALNVGPMDIIHSVDGKRFDRLDALIAYLEGREKVAPVNIVFRRSSPSVNRWMEFHTRELPGQEIRVVGAETLTSSSGH
jgi:S1-C subfamily serine protease